MQCKDGDTGYIDSEKYITSVSYNDYTDHGNNAGSYSDNHAHA